MSEQKPTLNIVSSQKYALKVTVNGRDYLFTRVGNNLALVPKTGNTMKVKFLAWDTPAQVKAFLDEIKKKYPEEFERVWGMKPDIIPVSAVQ